jgi:hypothetical protein
MLCGGVEAWLPFFVLHWNGPARATLSGLRLVRDDVGPQGGWVLLVSVLMIGNTGTETNGLILVLNSVVRV